MRGSIKRMNVFAIGIGLSRICQVGRYDLNSCDDAGEPSKRSLQKEITVIERTIQRQDGCHDLESRDSACGHLGDFLSTRNSIY